MASDAAPDRKHKIFVGGVNWTTNDEAFGAYFGTFGTVVDSVIMRNPDGKSRGFGFVTFAEKETLDKVLEMTEHSLDERRLDVKTAVPKEEQDQNRRKEGSTSRRTMKVFVGGLAPETTKETLDGHFEKYGLITDSIVMTDRESGRSRGFGFVTFDNEDSVEKVMEEEHTLDEKQVECKKAVPRDESDSGGRRGGGGGSRDDRRGGYDRGGYDRGGYDRGYDRYDRREEYGRRGGYGGRDDRGYDDRRGGGYGGRGGYDGGYGGGGGGGGYGGYDRGGGGYRAPPAAYGGGGGGYTGAGAGYGGDSYGAQPPAGGQAGWAGSQEYAPSTGSYGQSQPASGGYESTPAPAYGGAAQGYGQQASYGAQEAAPSYGAPAADSYGGARQGAYGAQAAPQAYGAYGADRGAQGGRGAAANRQHPYGR